MPVERRRRAAASAGLAAALLVAVGVVPWAGSAPGTLRIFSTVALAVAVLFALIGWGLLASVRADRAEARVDAAIAEAVTEFEFDCGHDHDPDEMRLTCPPGDACAHDCAICLGSTWRS